MTNDPLPKPRAKELLRLSDDMSGEILGRSEIHAEDKAEFHTLVTHTAEAVLRRNLLEMIESGAKSNVIQMHLQSVMAMVGIHLRDAGFELSVTISLKDGR